MSDRVFAVLFIGTVNLMVLTIFAICYQEGEIGGMIIFGAIEALAIFPVSVGEICKEFFEW